MQYSQSSSSGSHRRAVALTVVTWIVRELTGLVFIFSGFVKSVDVWGTVYKFHDYLGALGITLPSNLVLAGAFALCSAEFILGIFLVFVCYRRSSAVLTTCFMAVMLPLTLWIAISDPVADCGCFGDALKISNWQTFWKNVLLMGCAVWLLKFNTRIRCLITPAFQWMAVIASCAYMMAICWYGYNIQPMVDFRPYPAGSSLVSENDADSSSGYEFVYAKEGVERVFSDDSIPSEDDGWEFVSRRPLAATPPSVKEEKADFRILDKDGDEDVTEDVLADQDDRLLLLIPSLSEISASTTYKINMLDKWAESHDVDFAAIVAAGSGDIKEWEDLSMPDYDIYMAEDTSIKELARGNPSVVYLKDGKVVWKQSLWSIDDTMIDNNEEDVESMESQEARDAEALSPSPGLWLKRMSWLYALAMILLLIVSSVPNIYDYLRKKKKPDTDGEANV